MQAVAYLNGRYLPAGEAAISLTDAGFVLGATVTEQLRTFAGEPFRLDDHLARLARSLRIVDIQPALSLAEIADIARDVAQRNHALLAPNDDLGLSILVTPGPYATFAMADAGPTVCVSTFPLPFRLWAEKYRTGQSLATTSIQQVPAECWPPELKCRSRMHYYLADQQAQRRSRGARALLLDAAGRLTETATANVLLFSASEGLVSPPGPTILPGVSLQVVKELAMAIGIPFSERALTLDDAAAAEEILLTSTPSCLLPATSFNGQPVGRGQPGEMFRQLLDAWSQQVGVDIAEQAVRYQNRSQ